MALGGILSAALVAFLVIYAASGSSADQCLSSDKDERGREGGGGGSHGHGHGHVSVESLLAGSTDFALDLFRRVAQDAVRSESNLIFSPFSIWSALLITYLGSRGQTQVELSNVLRLLNVSKADAGRAYKAVKFWYKLRSRDEDKYALHLANALFVEKSVEFKPCVEKYFSDEMKRVDFARTPESARIEMNAWVEEQTRNRIHDLFPPGYVDGRMVLSIVNAAYFKGKWSSQFKKEATDKAEFRVSPWRKVHVDMMHQSGFFFHGVDPQLGARVLEMPFASEELSMMFLLPTEGTSLSQTVKQLNGHKLRSLRQRLAESEVFVSIPKFRLEHSFQLDSILGAMGIRDLFVVHHADLSGFSDDRRLSVSSVRHKAFLDVNEEGSEAAAASAILAWRSARPAFPASFVANEPFIFILHDNLSNSILFLGIVSRPEVNNDIL